jgi:hypothetical protein
MGETMVPLAAMRAALEAMEAYVPIGQRPNARAAALAYSIGFAFPPRPTAGSGAPRNDRAIVGAVS